MRQRVRGVTLIELLVSILLLAIVTISSLAALRFSDERSTRARQSIAVLNQLQSTLDTGRAFAFSGTMAVGTYSQALTVSGVPGTVTITSVVTGVPAKPDLYYVSSTASWLGGTRQITLTTIVRKGNVN